MNVRKNFDKNLAELQKKMTEMNRLTVCAFEKAFTAFKTQDVELALKVIDEDTAIDNLDQEINEYAVWLIAKEQPFATDLRRIIASLKITSDIERIADFAVNIAKATARIGVTESLITITKLEQMNEISLDMLKKAVSAFLDGDIALAKEVAELDDQSRRFLCCRPTKKSQNIYVRIQKKQLSSCNYYLSIVTLNALLTILQISPKALRI